MPEFSSAIPAYPYGTLAWEKDAVMPARTWNLKVASPGKRRHRPFSPKAEVLPQGRCVAAEVSLKNTKLKKLKK